MPVGDYNRPIEPVQEERQLDAGDRLVGDSWVIAQNMGQTVNDKTYSTPGVFGDVTMPSNWQMSTRGGEGAPNFDYLYTFKPPSAQGDVEISVFNRGGALSERGAQTLDKLLSDNANISSPNVLFDKSWPANDPRTRLATQIIRDLAEVLGRNHQGDNQFTNDSPTGSARAPAFDLEHLEVRKVNGKAVLSVDGKYKNKLTGATSSHFSGIYAQNEVTRHGNNVSEVHQMYLSSPDSVAFNANRSGYTRALNSIKW